MSRKKGFLFGSIGLNLGRFFFIIERVWEEEGRWVEVFFFIRFFSVGGGVRE